MRSYGEFCRFIFVPSRQSLRRGQFAGWLRTAAAILAVLAFLIDFVTPTTPTPIAVGIGKALVRPVLAILGIVIAAPCILLIVHFLASLYGILSRSDSELFELACVRRC